LRNQNYTEQSDDIKSSEINRIVLQHEALVRRIAYKMHSRVSTFVELDDLLQSGLEGLVDAAQKYTVVEGASFENYASIRIKGSMLDLIRRNGNLNRSTVQTKRKIDIARGELTAELGRFPSDEEVAKSLNISMEEFVAWTRVFEANVSESLSEVYDEYSLIFASPTIEPERLIDSENMRSQLVGALKTLSKQQSQVLQLYYVESLNTYEIAEVLDITPGRVSQIKSEAFKLLRKTLKEFAEPSE